MSDASQRAEAAPRRLGHLADFTTTPEVIPVALLAVAIGVASAFVALALARLIGLFTNVFFFQRWSAALISPAGHHLGLWVVVVPILGALVIGLMARYGSERIRGHGIPEAIEAILINGSRVEPKLAVLKPLSSAISIGSGGPFGAEGPIIMTGGALGSLIAQFFKFSAAERKTLLVAGAAGGMSATFASPVSATLLAVELLLFEWKPRSLIPVALASATAAAVRTWLMGAGPLFPTPPHSATLGVAALGGCALVGLMAGALSAGLTLFVYATEDAFQRLPIHWMWWPAIGGLVIGLGGLLFPEALGVGYDTIEQLLQGHASLSLIAGILIVKATIWAVALGSGTSGGVLAPLLMMGGAVGGLAAAVLPDQGAGFWALVGMGAIMGGTMRSPFTGIVFAIELTHDLNVLFPLLVAVMLAYAFTVLTMRRSILTEKVSRRGYHLTREYAFDPLEVLFVRDAMRTEISALPASATLGELARSFATTYLRKGQHLYPVVGVDGRLAGVVRRSALQEVLRKPEASGDQPLGALVRRDPIVVHPDESLQTVVFRMVKTGLTQFPVVPRDEHGCLVGIIALNDLLVARRRLLDEEQQRERVLGLPLLVRLRTLDS
jgi:H+/Cl- antiporter ClcA